MGGRQPAVVAERVNRTLKERALHGCDFRSVEDLRRAVAVFVNLYNAHWRLNKLGYLTPLEARQTATIGRATLCQKLTRPQFSWTQK